MCFPPHGGRLRRRQRLRRQWKQCRVFIITDCTWLVVLEYKCNPRVLGFHTPVPIHLVCSCVCQINDMEMKRKEAAERDKRFLQQRVIQDQKVCVCVEAAHVHTGLSLLAALADMIHKCFEAAVTVII